MCVCVAEPPSLIREPFPGSEGNVDPKARVLKPDLNFPSIARVNVDFYQVIHVLYRASETGNCSR